MIKHDLLIDSQKGQEADNLILLLGHGVANVAYRTIGFCLLIDTVSPKLWRSEGHTNTQLNQLLSTGSYCFFVDKHNMFAICSICPSFCGGCVPRAE